MLSVKTFCLQGLRTQRRPSARKTFFLISIFGFNFEARKRKEWSPSENLKRHTSVSWCQDCFSLLGKNEELQSIKYTMATHCTVHLHIALNSSRLLCYNGTSGYVSNCVLPVCILRCSALPVCFHSSTYWWLLLFVLWQRFFPPPSFCL